MPCTEGVFDRISNSSWFLLYGSGESSQGAGGGVHVGRNRDFVREIEAGEVDDV
jgi:hypothetical protein